MRTYTIIGGVNGVGKSSFTGVLKSRTTDLGVIVDVDKITAELGGNALAGGKAALKKIRETEELEPRKEAPPEFVGKRVLHPVFGEGTVIGKPRDQEGYIIQFDSMVTPRTFGAGVKLVFLT